jgi:hypothetical protein
MRSRATYLPHFRGNMDVALHAQQNRAVVSQKSTLLPSAAALQVVWLRGHGGGRGRGNSSAAHGAGRSVDAHRSGLKGRGVGHSYRGGERERVVDGKLQDGESTIVAMDSGSRGQVLVAGTGSILGRDQEGKCDGRSV